MKKFFLILSLSSLLLAQSFETKASIVPSEVLPTSREVFPSNTARKTDSIREDWQTQMPCICVAVPVFERGDALCDWIFENFRKQNYPNKKLFVLRDNGVEDNPSPERRYAQAFWREKMAEMPDQVKYWEVDHSEFPEGKFSLAHKRNIINAEIIKPEYGCHFIATMDDDDIYSVDYLTSLHREFAQNPKLMLVKFRNFLRLQIIGTPPSATLGSLDFPNPDIITALNKGRAFQDMEKATYVDTLDIQDSQNKWHLSSHCTCLPTGFGFSFMYRAEVVSQDRLKYKKEIIRKGNKKSGEEDSLYLQILRKYGKGRIKQLPLSKTWRLAVHMENGRNTSGQSECFRFPSDSFVSVPRPIGMLHVGLLRHLAQFHPNPGLRYWGKMLLHAHLASTNGVNRFYETALLYQPNLNKILEFTEKWKQPAHWEQVKTKSCFFVPPTPNSKRLRELDGNYAREVEKLLEKGSDSFAVFPAFQDIPLEFTQTDENSWWKIKPTCEEEYLCPKKTYERFEKQTQRSLVVIPGSHRKLYKHLKAAMEYQSQEESKNWGDFQGVKLKEVLRYGNLGSQEKQYRVWEQELGEEFQQRAVQLDIRGACGEDSTCMLIWNSALVHQGATSVNQNTLYRFLSKIDPDQLKPGGNCIIPALYTPATFRLEEETKWRDHLEKEGYVILKDIIKDMRPILKALLEDIRKINPTFEGKNLDEVKEKHLGIDRRGLRYTLGMPQGEFAWRIRNHPNVLKAWEVLYSKYASSDKTPVSLIGSLDVPALSIEESSETSLEEWLHLDQNPTKSWTENPDEMYPNGDKVMYQSFIYLFPSSCKFKNPFGGSRWNRIATVLCMVPSAYGRTKKALDQLLALAITGEASNHWPQTGVASWYGAYGSRNITDRRLTESQCEKNGWRRMLPKLNPALYWEENIPFVENIIKKLGFSTSNPEGLSQGGIQKSLEFLQMGEGCKTEFEGPSLKYQQSNRLLRLLSSEELKKIVHPRVLQYLGETEVELTQEGSSF